MFLFYALACLFVNLHQQHIPASRISSNSSCCRQTFAIQRGRDRWASRQGRGAVPKGGALTAVVVSQEAQALAHGNISLPTGKSSGPGVKRLGSRGATCLCCRRTSCLRFFIRIVPAFEAFAPSSKYISYAPR